MDLALATLQSLVLLSWRCSRLMQAYWQIEIMLMPTKLVMEEGTLTFLWLTMKPSQCSSGPLHPQCPSTMVTLGGWWWNTHPGSRSEIWLAYMVYLRVLVYSWNSGRQQHMPKVTQVGCSFFHLELRSGQSSGQVTLHLKASMRFNLVLRVPFLWCFMRQMVLFSKACHNRMTWDLWSLRDLLEGHDKLCFKQYLTGSECFFTNAPMSDPMMFEKGSQLNRPASSRGWPQLWCGQWPLLNAWLQNSNCLMQQTSLHQHTLCWHPYGCHWEVYCSTKTMTMMLLSNTPMANGISHIKMQYKYNRLDWRAIGRWAIGTACPI